MVGPFLGLDDSPHLLSFVEVTSGWRLGDAALCTGLARKSLYNSGQLCLSWFSFSMKELPISTSTSMENPDSSDSPAPKGSSQQQPPLRALLSHASLDLTGLSSLCPGTGTVAPHPKAQGLLYRLRDEKRAESVGDFARGQQEGRVPCALFQLCPTDSGK